MSLRTRLIIAFLCLSVIPLSAVTGFWYVSSVSAFEGAAQREGAQTAAEIGRRMELLTHALGRRVDRLFEVSAEDAERGLDHQRVRARIAPLLGDAAVLLERVEFHTEAPIAPPPAGDEGGHPAANLRGRRSHPAPPHLPRPPSP